jgi:hypothetical protein
MHLDLNTLRSKPWLNLGPEIVRELTIPGGFIGEE